MAAALVLSTISPVAAQDSSRISITPVTFNLTANAGDTLKEVIKVRNDATTAQQIAISTENFTAVGEDGGVGLTEQETSYSLADWVSFEKTNFTLKSGEEVQVNFLIRVPFNAEPGGHYASVYAHVSPAGVEGTSGSSIGQKIGSLVLLRVAGDVKEQASVASFSVDKINLGKSVTFSIRAKNEGSVHIRPAGFVAITDLFGKKVADAQVKDQNVFPGAIRHLTAEWKNPSILPMRYTANVLMYYGQNNQQLTASMTFWIVPWRMLGIVGGSLLVLLVLLFLGRRRIGRSLKALVSGK